LEAFYSSDIVAPRDKRSKQGENDVLFHFSQPPKRPMTNGSVEVATSSSIVLVAMDEKNQPLAATSRLHNMFFPSIAKTSQ